MEIWGTELPCRANLLFGCVQSGPERTSFSGSTVHGTTDHRKKSFHPEMEAAPGTTGRTTGRTDRGTTTMGRMTRPTDGQRTTTVTLGRTRWDGRTEDDDGDNCFLFDDEVNGAVHAEATPHHLPPPPTTTHVNPLSPTPPED